MIKNYILKLVFSRLGPTVTSAVSTAVGFLLGWLVTGTSALGFHLTADQQTEVSLALTAVTYWLITELVNKYAGDKAETIQKILQDINPTLKVDRWIGAETVAAAQATAQAAAVNPSTGDAEVYQGLPVPPPPQQQKLKPKKRKYINPLRK